MRDRTGSVIRLFDRGTRWYRAQTILERRAVRGAVDTAAPLDGLDVVDLGAGTGVIARELERRGIRVASFVGVDAAPKMLAQWVPPRGDRSGTWRALHADARAVPLPTGCADVVMASYLLHLLETDDRRAVLGEARRLLRPDGRLVVVVHTTPSGVIGVVYRAIWSLLTAPLRLGGIVYRPFGSVEPDLLAAGFAIEVSHLVPGVYWSAVVRARPVAESHGP